jgi:S-DNA-T family DNA segregation ATPase FtsK/SpoIIIE
MKKESENLKLQANVIEQTLDSFGIRSRVVEINTLEKETEFYLEVALGTNIKKIENIDTTIAMALASLTGKIKVQAPIPGRALVGVTVPTVQKTGLKGIDKRVSYKIIEKTKVIEKEPIYIDKTWWRNITFVLGNIFDLIRELFEKISKFFWKLS